MPSLRTLAAATPDPPGRSGVVATEAADEAAVQVEPVPGVGMGMGGDVMEELASKNHPGSTQGLHGVPGRVYEKDSAEFHTGIPAIQHASLPPCPFNTAGMVEIPWPTPCPTCGGFQVWWDVLGQQRCQRCEAGQFRRGLRFLNRAAKLSSLQRAQP